MTDPNKAAVTESNAESSPRLEKKMDKDMNRAAIVTKLNYMAKQYTNGSIARGGNPSKHYLEEAADIIKAQEAELAALRAEPVAFVSEVYQSRYTLEWNGHVLPVGTKLYAAPSRETAKQTYSQEELSAADKRADARHDKLKIDAAEPALSAKQFSERDIEYWRRQLLLIEWSSPKTDHLHINTLCDMALSSLTARDEGIEAVLNDEALHLSDRQRSRVRNLKGQP